MTELSFGQIYDTGGLMDVESGCSLSTRSTTQTAISLTSSFAPPSSTYSTGIYAPRFFSDNSGNRCFAFVIGGPQLKIYSVDTVGLTITLDSTTSFTPTDTVAYYFGVKKVNSNLYYVYYGSRNSGTGALTYYRFRRISIVPGVSYSDDLLEEITFSEASCHFYIQDHKLLGKTVCIGVIKTIESGLNIIGLGVEIHSLNMKTEGITGGEQWAVTPGNNVDISLSYREGICLSESGGSLVWVCAYQFNEQVSPFSSYCHIVITGTDNVVHTFTYSSPIALSESVGVPFQYNTRDYLYRIYFKYKLGVEYRAIITTGGVITTVASFPTATPFRSFNSQSSYPVIVSSGGSAYWADPTTGLTTSLLTISGVNTIQGIFPTLDRLDNSIYLYVKMNDASYKLIGINLSSTITRTIDIGAGNVQYDFNHGNFLLNGSGSNRVDYIVNVIGKGNVLQMLIEWN